MAYRKPGQGRLMKNKTEDFKFSETFGEKWKVVAGSSPRQANLEHFGQDTDMYKFWIPVVEALATSGVRPVVKGTAPVFSVAHNVLENKRFCHPRSGKGDLFLRDVLSIASGDAAQHSYPQFDKQTAEAMEKFTTQYQHPISLNLIAYQQVDTNTAGPFYTTILPEQTASSGFPENIEVIHDEPDAIVDVCFVHGLTGNRTSAWTLRRKPGLWPKTLLALKLEKVHILAFGYNARDASAPPETIIDHTLRLLSGLTNNRLASGASYHPLIFVARGLGDLICKYAVIISHASRSDLTRGVCQFLERLIHLGAHNEPDEEIGFGRAFLWTPQLIDDGMIDRVQPLFNSWLRTQNGEDKGTYMPFDFKMQPTQRSPLGNTTDSARLRMCNDSPSYGYRIHTTTLSEAGDPAVQSFITGLRVLIAASRRHETSCHNTSETEVLASTGLRAVRSSNNDGAPRFRREVPTTEGPYTRSHSPRPIDSLQTTNAASSPSPLPTTNYWPAGVYNARPCYIICFLMSLIIAGSAGLGIYYTVRFDKMGDGFTTASWIVAVSTLALAGPLARHYPRCSCWGPRIPYSCELRRTNTLSNV